MSEYWKSTPKYWCKHCKTFVRDTKLEKANHDATPKHQGNLKRFLRDLHRGHEKDAKDKERAKAEVARLNGMTSSGRSEAGPSSSSLGLNQGPTPSFSKPKGQATAAQRKQQLSQLAEMGISIPDEFRPDMAMAGEWEVTSERVVEPEGEKKTEAVALGVRKRVIGEEEEAEIEARKRRWGSTYRTHPNIEDDGDLDALLSSATRKGKLPMATEVKEEAEVKVKEEVKDEIEQERQGRVETVVDASEMFQDEDGKEGIKMESVGEPTIPITTLQSDSKPEIDDSLTGVVFKKRKAKNIRQK